MKKIKILTLLFAAFTLPFLLHAMNESDVILPKPVSIRMDGGTHQIPDKITIHAPGNILEADFFVDEVKDQCGLKAEITFDKSGANLLLSTDKNIVAKPEGYRLKINPDNIEIIGHDDAGVFYGLQSLLQLYNSAKGNGVLPTQTIKDAPEFAWRAYLIDEGRYFKGGKGGLPDIG